MKIFEDYLATIEAAMSASKKSKTRSTDELTKGYSSIGKPPRKSMTLDEAKKQLQAKRLFPSLDELAKTVGLQINFEQQLGNHPDFSYLRDSEGTENHYIVSMFIDIKGSTNLFRSYEPEIVWHITNTIQKAAIHTCLIFGGYVHRLHGDGLFVYFGGRNLSKEIAVKRALQSASVFSYFVKHDLRDLFLEHGIERIYTRIGIDLGHEDAVIWGKAGIGSISEVTTCSLHTSLAFKMQSNAESNGIVVGDYVKDLAPDAADFFSSVAKRTANESNRYIFQIPEESFHYSQHDFWWPKYLQNQDFIVTDLDGKLSLKKKAIAASPLRSTESLSKIAAVNKPYYE